jgi:peptidoglycan/xylan/chitin deacetylase (PgdA/CDA1 family)
MSGTVAIKVDVDTFRGMTEGVPVLLDLFRRHDVRASFFVPMGKDHTGRTVKRVFRKGFLKKAGRVGVVDTYGVKTLMFGLLLPGPEIALGNGALLARVAGEGHEVGIHGLDHVFWHDRVRHLSRERTEEELDAATDVYNRVVGKAPRSFAAPGWTVNVHALRYFEKKGFLYTSNTRGLFPCFPRLSGQSFGVLEIPSTLPTLDEAVGRAGVDQEDLAAYFLGGLTEGLNVLTVHTEMEGRRWTGFLERFVIGAKARGYTFERLVDVAGAVLAKPSVPTCAIEFGFVEGRAGEVCCQAAAP